MQETNSDEPKFSDTDRRAFLAALDNSTIELDPHAEMFLQHVRSQMNYSPAQRAIIDKLIDKHGEALGF